MYCIVTKKIYLDIFGLIIIAFALALQIIIKSETFITSILLLKHSQLIGSLKSITFTTKTLLGNALLLKNFFSTFGTILPLYFVNVHLSDFRKKQLKLWIGLRLWLPSKSKSPGLVKNITSMCGLYHIILYLQIFQWQDSWLKSFSTPFRLLDWNQNDWDLLLCLG